MHFSDFDGNILKSFNLNPIIKSKVNSNEEKIFVADDRDEIFVFDSNFKRLFQFGNELKDPVYMKIDNEFDKTRLYVYNFIPSKITIWSTVDGEFIGQIICKEFETQCNEIVFTRNSVFVSGFDVCFDESILEIDKASLEIKIRIRLD